MLIVDAVLLYNPFVSRSIIQEVSSMVEARVNLVDVMHFEGRRHPATGWQWTPTMQPVDRTKDSGDGAAPCRVWRCTGMDVISILRKKRQNVTGLATNVRGEQRRFIPAYL